MADFSLQPSPEVAQALAAGAPVVALESTIITHGMPWPQNVDTARAVEAVVRDAGATPATIAVLEGRFCVGLDDDALERLGRAGLTAAKASRRDLAHVASAGLTAGTTVSATMILAHAADIPVFATGGIGGVHRGAETTFDISADLVEFGRTPVAVVCAGAKSILDLPKTLEYLETQGVPVVGYGTDRFPAFFTRDSGLALDQRVDSVGALAALVGAQQRLGLGQGIVIANPIPEADALDPAEIDARIAEAIAEAESEGIVRKAVTPYLLARIFELTGGRSLAANIALVRNNARLAAELAVALASGTRG